MNRRIPDSVVQLSRALRLAVSDRSGAMWHLVSATELMLRELQDAAGVHEKGDLHETDERRERREARLSLGRRIQLLALADVLPRDVREELGSVVQLRNIAVHNPIPKDDAETIGAFQFKLLSVFTWYLTDSEFGPRIDKGEAAEVIRNADDIGTDRSTPRMVFLSYATEDHARVREVYAQIRKRGHTPWMDKVDLLPGQNWESEIRSAIERADCFVVFLSPRSVEKRGFVQKEIRFALDVLGEIPPGTIFLIPVRLEPCDIPAHLSFLHYIDLDAPETYDRLFAAIEHSS